MLSVNRQSPPRSNASGCRSANRNLRCDTQSLSISERGVLLLLRSKTGNLKYLPRFSAKIAENRQKLLQLYLQNFHSKISKQAVFFAQYKKKANFNGCRVVSGFPTVTHDSHQFAFATCKATYMPKGLKNGIKCVFQKNLLAQ